MIRELINKYYEERQNSRDKNIFWITDIAKCPRKIWFAFKGYEAKPKEARILRAFEHGDHTHIRLMSVLFSLGIVVGSEVFLQNELVRGKADAIINIENKPFVLEIKSINHHGFLKLDKPEIDHIKQIQLYMHFLNIPRGILLYENKNTQELKEFFVQYDKEFANKLIQQLERLKEQIEKNILPEIPVDLPDWKCNVCEYKEVCLKMEKERRKKKSQDLF